MLRIIVLGAAAGGGVPQWNCACDNCRAARLGVLPAQTQSSIAVSADGERWLLVNASPDLRTQFAQTPALRPAGHGRHSPLAAVLLTNADVDHTAGLLSLREAQAFPVYATTRVLAVLEANPIFNVLNRQLVARRPLALADDQIVCDAAGNDLGIRVDAFAIPGKVALWLENPALPQFGSVAEDTIGLIVSSPGSRERLVYLPGCAELPAELLARIRPDDSVLFDGTTFTDDEMPALGLGHKTAARMGHLSMSGAEGSVARWQAVSARRKLFIHINNTNPVLLPGGPARREIERQGWALARDGMELHLD